MVAKIESQRMPELLARALLYHWAAGLYAYPEEDEGECLWSEASRARLELAAEALPTEQHLNVQQALQAVWQARTESINSSSGAISVPAEFTFLFAREVQAPPYEGGYRQMAGFSMGHELSDLASFYAAFGFQVAEKAKERPDHITVELEFLAALYAKEVYALEQEWGAQARVTRKVREKFLREHVIPWVQQFAALVRQKSRLPFYPALSGLVCTLVTGEHIS